MIERKLLRQALPSCVRTVAERERERERVIDRLSIDHLNEEEKRSLLELCFDYQDVFYLPGIN